jgi:hypothetical protein
LRGLAARGTPGQTLNVRAADADIGKLTVAKTGQFVETLVVALPLLESADDRSKHGVSLSLRSDRSPVNRIIRKIGIFQHMKRNFVAPQLSQNCIAQEADY